MTGHRGTTPTIDDSKTHNNPHMSLTFQKLRISKKRKVFFTLQINIACSEILKNWLQGNFLDRWLIFSFQISISPEFSSYRKIIFLETPHNVLLSIRNISISMYFPSLLF